MNKRKIAVIVGSWSDLETQGNLGLIKLRDAEFEAIEILGIHVASIHRNTEDVLRITKELKDFGVDVLIVGAGWANHLTGTVDAYLRNTLHDNHVVVVGVAFEDSKNEEHTKAAISSITNVPGTQVVFNDYVGATGFMEACNYAISGVLPEIKKTTPKPVESFTIAEAIELTKPKIKEE